MKRPDVDPGTSQRDVAAAAPPAHRPLSSWQARTWRAVGAASVTIGVVNAFIPLLPTTIFLLIGVWSYGKGDPRIRERLLAHPRFGPALRDWVEHRQISTRGKVAACTAIALSMAITAWLVGSTPVTWIVDAGLAGLILYLATRPGPRSAPPSDRQPTT